MGDCAMTLNSVSDPICSEDGTIQIDMLPWDRISNKPSTLAGYNLTTDVADKYYNKKEIDSKLANISIKDVYTKKEIDAMFDNIDMSAVDAYTKKEIDDKLANITAAGVDIDEDALNTMLASILI
jgi:hypothetical protein